jgi:cytochrome c biogenesis protein CcdA/thiol-disulfide isomerase/thioredoxin
MVVLLGIAFLAGVITAVSPCVLPVLPIVLAGGASGGRRRPYAIVAGLLLSFVVSILLATWILHELGLPEDLLRNVAIGLLFLVAATLVVPRLGLLVERPLARLARGPRGDLGGGFVLGVALGFVFVPCGGLILGYVSAQAATLDLGLKPVGVAIAYALGASVVLLGIALGGRRASAPLRSTRFRAWLGVLMAASALALVFDADTRLQKSLPNWTHFLQSHTEDTAFARKKIGVHNVTERKAASSTKTGLPDYGAAPNFAGISHWLNTSGGKPLTIAGLRGKVVLIDFWTYSCINCLRTLPYLESWDRTYRRDGLVIVGVHSPEFAFEHNLSNVRGNARKLGVRYPVALDNEFGTWNAYGNQYWPAEYLIDRRGHLRHAHFGEGEYDQTEAAIRKLLAEPGMELPSALDLADRTPTGLITPESYLGYGRLARYAGSPIHENRLARYELPFKLDQDELAYGGFWKVEGERIVAGRAAGLRLHFHARKVHLVLGGRGQVRVLVDGRPGHVVRVTDDRLYTLVREARITDGLLELQFTPGLSAYAFTFG